MSKRKDKFFSKRVSKSFLVSPIASLIPNPTQRCFAVVAASVVTENGREEAYVPIPDFAAAVAVDVAERSEQLSFVVDLHSSIVHSPRFHRLQASAAEPLQSVSH